MLDIERFADFANGITSRWVTDKSHSAGGYYTGEFHDAEFFWFMDDRYDTIKVKVDDVEIRARINRYGIFLTDLSIIPDTTLVKLALWMSEQHGR